MKLVIITPRESSTFNGVSSVTLPGSEGRFTVLRHHAPLIAAIKQGVLHYDRNEIPIHGGVVEVNNNMITVITE